MVMMSTMSTASTAAPGRLEIVRQFVNTNDIDQATDSLSHAVGVAAWFRANELLPARATVVTDDAERARAVREALRNAMLANHDGDPIDAPSLDVLNAAAREARLGATLTAEARPTVGPGATGVAGALGALLAIVMDAMGDGAWTRLKVCANGECRWAFYDHSRARSGKWCSMGACGNRAKQRAWRERHG